MTERKVAHGYMKIEEGTEMHTKTHALAREGCKPNQTKPTVFDMKPASSFATRLRALHHLSIKWDRNRNKNLSNLTCPPPQVIHVFILRTTTYLL